MAIRINGKEEVVIGAGSLSSSTLRTLGGLRSMAFRISATAACRYAVGSAPVAGAADTYLPANTVVDVRAYPDEKIAVIQEVGAGKLSVSAIEYLNQ